MKKRILSLALAFIVLLTFCSQALAVSDIGGYYMATSCTKDGDEYDCCDEYLLLNADGTGEVVFNGDVYDISWNLDDSGSIYFIDSDGYELTGGVYADGFISGNYGGYDYIYELDTNGGVMEPSQALPGLDISGYYMATSCTKDGDAYDCGGEYLLLNEDGSGEVVFDGHVFDILWSIDEIGNIFLIDSDGLELTEGVYANGIIRGNYGGYDYIYELDTTAETAESGSAGLSVESYSYYPTSCVKDGESYSVDGEYIVINADGSGMVVFEGCAYGIEWDSDGTYFDFTDSMGNMLTGTLSDDVITASFHGYEYVYEPGYPAPILSLSPDTWGVGLPLVLDQAGILSEDERSTLQTQAERISETYSCNVHIVILDDMENFSLSNSIESCAEEIRTGYSLGFGTGKDCVMLLMSMEERDYDLCAYGDFGNASFTDYGKDTLENEFLDNFGDNDWFGGFSDYLSKSDEILAMSAAGTPLDVGTVPVSPLISLAISLLLGFLIAFAVCMVIKQKMKAVKEKTRAEEYVADGGANITYRYDQYTHTTESRVYDPPTKSSGSGGTSRSSSGHSHSSGKF